MISSITCDTSISDIISEEDISSIILVLAENIKFYLDSVNNQIHEEELNGLSQNGFNIEGTPLLSNCAEELLSSISLNDSFDNLSNNLYVALSTQRMKELNQLSLKIKEKISDLTSSYNAYLSDYSSCTDESRKSSLGSHLSELSASIKKYKNKLNIVNGMM